MKILVRQKVSTRRKITHTKTFTAKFIRQRCLKVPKSRSKLKISWTERKWHIWKRMMTFQLVLVRYLGNKSKLVISKLGPTELQGSLGNISTLYDSTCLFLPPRLTFFLTKSYLTNLVIPCPNPARGTFHTLALIN